MESPGDTLEKKLLENAMSRKELSQRINISEKHISTVINGERPITASFAKKLGYVFEDMTFWLNLQMKYEEEQAHIREEKSITQEEIDILKPLGKILQYFIECGYIKNNCGDTLKVMQLRSLLNVSNLLQIPQVTYNAAYRAQLSSNIKVDPYVLFAWQKLCELKTKDIPTEKTLDIERLKNRIPDIKQNMFNDFETIRDNLKSIMAECGIRFEIVKSFRGAPVQGFIKSMADNRLILCLTNRGQRADRFWFTLFHEIAHIINGDYSSRFVDFDTVRGEMEEKADALAGSFLIDPEWYKKFVRSDACITRNGIIKFAEFMKVPPFVVLGRLQNDGILEWSEYPELMVQYKETE